VMAFCSKLGGLLRQSVSGSSISNESAPVMHLLNSVRYMSSSKLFVGGLSYGTDDQSLKDAFNSYGNVTEVKVIIDRESGRSRGFGFVNFDSEESAGSALSSMDGQELHGRNIRVSYATERQTGGYRGGFGDNNSRFGTGGGY